MEGIHKPELLPWISEPITLQDMIELAYENPLDGCFTKKKSLKEAFQESSPNVDFEAAMKAISLDDYYDPLEQKIAIGRQFEIPQNVNLKSLRLQKSHAEKRTTDLPYDVFCYNSSKCRDYPWGKPIIEDGQDSFLSDADTINLPEIILTVQIYHPVRRNPNISAIKMQLDQEFYVVGQQFLTEFRDKIICLSDEAVLGEWSDSPDLHTEGFLAKDIYKSGTFYFGTTFYNDCRFPNNVNYGEELKEWAEKHATGIGPFNCAQMEETRFIDLTIRLGYPYVYIHQGDCEHIIAFTDARLMTKDDILCRPLYPMRARVFPKKGIACMVCNKATATWVVTNNPELPEEPFAFCGECFQKFNYDENGRKIGKFQARVLPDRAAII